jgi:transcriptional regulator with XRE-family HTH domain
VSEPTSIPARLRAIREGAGFTQAALAERLGSTPKRVANIEGGRRRASVDLMAQWAEACGRGFVIEFPTQQVDDPDARAACEALVASNAEVRFVVARILSAARGASAPSLDTLRGLVDVWERMPATRARKREAE